MTIPALPMPPAQIQWAVSRVNVKRASLAMASSVSISTSARVANTVALLLAGTALIARAATRASAKRALSAVGGNVPMLTSAPPKTHPVTSEPSVLTNRVLIAARTDSSISSSCAF